MLHIVIAAVRPFTVAEMNIALAIHQDCTTEHDLKLIKPQRLISTMRNICGLFVSVVDDKFYLLHQTAKEFLVPRLELAEHPQICLTPNSPPWKAVINPGVSHFLLAQMCIVYLHFNELWDHNLSIDETHYNDWVPSRRLKPIHSQIILSFLADHAFMECAAMHWMTHFRLCNSQLRDSLLDSAMEIFQTNSKSFMTWLLVHRIRCNVRLPSDVTCLMAASRFGHSEIVGQLIGQEVNINLENSRGQTALTLAAKAGHYTVAKLLLAQGTILVDL